MEQTILYLRKEFKGWICPQCGEIHCGFGELEEEDLVKCGDCGTVYYVAIPKGGKNEY